MGKTISMKFKRDQASQDFARLLMGALRDNNASDEWQPISPGDKAFEYPCPTCDADIHEFCTSKDQYGANRQHHTEVHWSRCEAADGRDIK